MIHCFQDVLICLMIDLFIVDWSVCQMISVPQIIDPKWDSFSAACYRKPEDNREHCFSTEGANTLGGDHCSRHLIMFSRYIKTYHNICLPRDLWWEGCAVCAALCWAGRGRVPVQRPTLSSCCALQFHQLWQFATKASGASWCLLNLAREKWRDHKFLVKVLVWFPCRTSAEDKTSSGPKRAGEGSSAHQ